MENRGDDNSNPGSSKDPKAEESQNSKGSGQNNLKMELNKITEEIRGHEENYVSDGLEFQGLSLEDNSQSTGSGRMSGEITDMNEKLKIISIAKKDRGAGTAGATTRRKRRANADGGSKTKKKNYLVADETTVLDDTAPSIPEVSLNDATVLEPEDREIYELHCEFRSNIDKFMPEARPIFEASELQQMKEFMHLQKETNPGTFDGPGPEEAFTLMQDTELPYPDYTMSQPVSVPMFSQDLVKELVELKEEEEFTLDELVERSGKDKSSVLYQMLWKAQNNEIRMQQPNPESFGEILISSI